MKVNIPKAAALTLTASVLAVGGCGRETSGLCDIDAPIEQLAHDNTYTSKKLENGQWGSLEITPALDTSRVLAQVVVGSSQFTAQHHERLELNPKDNSQADIQLGSVTVRLTVQDTRLSTTCSFSAS